MYFSLVLPSYNAANALKNQLPSLISYLNSLGKDYELIVVDDGSDDEGETAKAAEMHGCIFLQNKKNSGKGAAVRKGMLHAKGEYRIFTDADIPFQYDAIEKFLYYLDFKEFSLVVGDRTLTGSAYFDNIPQNRKLASTLFSFVVGRFITTGMFDTQCGIKGFRSAAARDIFSKGQLNSFAFDVELIYIALKRNYDIKRLPVVLRNSENSSVSLLKHSLGMGIDLLRIKMNHVRGLYQPDSIHK